MKCYAIIIFFLLFQCNNTCKKADDPDFKKTSNAVSEVNNPNSETSNSSLKSENITIEGVVRLVGNEPFSYLIIYTDDKKSYRLPAKTKADYIKYQTLRVKVTGLVENQVLESADHKHKFDIKTITPNSIEIISSGMNK